MRISNLAILVVGLSAAISASAQQITWTSVGTGAPVTYNRIGNTTFGSDGSTFNRIGNTTFSNNGTSYNQIGNSTFGSDGSSATRIGNSTFINTPNGGRVTCNTIGSSTFCN